MPHLVDTSVLVRRADPHSAAQMIAATALDRLDEKGDPLHLFGQNLIEFWAVATRPNAVNGLGLSVMEANAERRRLESVMILLPDHPEVYARWVYLVNQYSVSGKPTHDARIVAAMLAHGITHILTFNGRDFRRFTPEGIVVVDPADVT